jgi:murein DD-endopeptidase MepM/ murein hydrolase activator NlpD
MPARSAVDDSNSCSVARALLRSYDMRWVWLACAIATATGCGPAPGTATVYAGAPEPTGELAPVTDMARAGVVIGRTSDFAFHGGRVEIEMRRDGDHIYEIARNYYAVPLVMEWQLGELVNLGPLAPLAGVARLPAAAAPNAEGPPIVLTTLQILDPTQSYRLGSALHERFGDPNAVPQTYAYRLPYRSGKTFTVLQGFHGSFSHRGANEFAVDFDCPVATPVLAARPGLVVATHEAAQGAGTTPEFLEYARTNFVIVLHDDGTLGEYMHLAPSGVKVTPGQRVARGDELALSGNTGFSSTPHLHFELMTAGDDGRSARSFPFRIAVAAGKVEEPVQGRAYLSWE